MLDYVRNYDSHWYSTELNILSRPELCVTVGAGTRKQSSFLAWCTPADRKLTWIDKQLRRWPNEGHDLGTVRWWAALNTLCHHCFCILLCSGGGSVLQHLVAHGGNTQPPLFKSAMTSSTFLPSQYNYNDPIPEVIPVHIADVHRMLNSATRCCIVRLSMEQSKSFQKLHAAIPYLIPPLAAVPQVRIPSLVCALQTPIRCRPWIITSTWMGSLARPCSSLLWMAHSSWRGLPSR
jgi:hypothetical protein